MRSLGLLSLPLLLWSTTACALVSGSGVIRTQARDVAPFRALEVSGGLHVTVRQGDRPGVQLTGDDNLLPLLRVEVQGDRLVIAPRDRASWLPTRPIEVAVATKGLERVQASGGIELALEGGLAPHLSLELSGGVRARARALALERLDLDASGGAELALAGSARRLGLDLSGGVALDARGLKADAVTLDASGGCDVQLDVRESLAGEASGGVSVVVRGSPARATLDTSGGADVRYER